MAVKGPYLRAADGRIVATRRLRAGDAGALQAFYRSLSRKTLDFFPVDPESFDAIARQVARAISGEDLAYVAVVDGAIVAFYFLCRIRGPVPTLGIVIGDAWQDQKLGRQMLTALLEEARSLGREAVDLTTMVHNDRAFHLYQSVGFRYVGRTTLQVGGGQTRVERRLVYPLTANGVARLGALRAD
ncbi:MAG TPA: GNAT family N-acetyltransferase [Chthonomonadales bacterium]|nr:GNAT family N-acetyltransferase [Chthonomonadales bacterium]